MEIFPAYTYIIPQKMEKGKTFYGFISRENGFFASLRMTLTCHCEHTAGMRGNP